MQRVQDNLDYTAWTQPVFPGIALIHLSAHGKVARLAEVAPTSAEVLEIFHCREGRMELNIGGEYCYVSPGDLLIARTRKIASEVCFPLRHYHGLIVRVDVQQTPHCLSCILQDVNVQPQLIVKRFCNRQEYFIARSNPSFEHIFSEMYAIPDAIKEGFASSPTLLPTTATCTILSDTGIACLPEKACGSCRFVIATAVP